MTIIAVDAVESVADRILKYSNRGDFQEQDRKLDQAKDDEKQNEGPRLMAPSYIGQEIVSRHLMI